MDDLVAWLRGVLDQDEALVWAATRGPWQVDGPYWWEDEPGGPRASSIVTAGSARIDVVIVPRGHRDADADWIAAMDPVHGLAVIVAVRAVLEQREQIGRDLAEASADPRRQMNIPILVNVALALDQVLKNLASAYADRPGYREEWLP